MFPYMEVWHYVFRACGVGSLFGVIVRGILIKTSSDSLTGHIYCR